MFLRPGCSEPLPQDSGQSRPAPGLTRRSACPSRPTQGRGSRRHRGAVQAPTCPQTGDVDGIAAHQSVRSAADEAQAQEATLDGGEASSAEDEKRRVEQPPDNRGGLPARHADEVGGSGRKRRCIGRRTRASSPESVRAALAAEEHTFSRSAGRCWHQKLRPVLT